MQPVVQHKVTDRLHHYARINSIQRTYEIIKHINDSYVTKVSKWVQEIYAGPKKTPVTSIKLCFLF